MRDVAEAQDAELETDRSGGEAPWREDDGDESDAVDDRTEDASAKKKPGKPARPERPERRSRPAPERSSELRAIQIAEDSTLKGVIEELGPQGNFRIALKRLEPEIVRDPTTGQNVRTSGHLKSYHDAIDEQYIAQHHGGGKYELRFSRKNLKGSMVWFTNRIIEVAGDPRLDDPHLARNALPTVVATPTHAPTSESPTLVARAFDVLTAQIDKQDQRNQHRVVEQPRGIDPAIQQLLAMFQRQIDASNTRLEQLQAELVAARNVKPVEDPFRDRLMGRLIEDDSARIQGLRAQYESEMRMLREQHSAEEKRIRDTFDREKMDWRSAHDREITALKQSHEITLQAAKASFDTSTKILEQDNRRLERDLNELRLEVKGLRERKDKGVLEQFKEMNALREELGVDENEKGTVEKVFEAIPGAIEVAKSMIQQPQQQAPAQQVAAAQQQQGGHRRQVVATPDGQRWILDEKGNLTPARKKTKPKGPQKDANGLPVIDQSKLDVVVGYLERAFAANQDPEIFAQSCATMVPEEVLGAIRTLGVDDFLVKVAKLPSNSPLAQMSGKNWVRKVGTALIGGE